MPTVFVPPSDGRPPAGRSSRSVHRSRVASYVLLAVAAVVLSLRPTVFGDPLDQPWHALLHVWRLVFAGLLVAGAVGVQVVVGARWRRVAEAPDEASLGTGNHRESDGSGPA